MSHPDHKLPAAQAISCYWRHLLGVILFPPIALAMTKLIEMQRDHAFFLLTILFFSSVSPVVWLLLTQKVRYSFWLVAIGVYFSAGILTSIAYQVIRAVGA